MAKSATQTASAPDSGPLLIDVPAAATICCISKRLLWSLTNQGIIPSRRIGRRVLYSPAELSAWIDAGCPTNPQAKGGK